MKTCSRCQLEKPLSEFWKSRSGRTRDGYKGECKECAKARRREWAKKNREVEAEYQRDKYAKDPERYIKAAQEWAAQNPEKVRAYSRKSEAARRARKSEAWVEDVDPATVFERDKGICGICQRAVDPQDYHIDHTIPLVKGGMHSYANVQLAHPHCNLSKGASL